MMVPVLAWKMGAWSRVVLGWCAGGVRAGSGWSQGCKLLGKQQQNIYS
jgi:hypothetical protein